MNILKNDKAFDKLKPQFTGVNEDINFENNAVIFLKEQFLELGLKIGA